MSCCSSCGTNPCNCCNQQCQPANTVYRGTCTDPGVLTSLRFLTGLDNQFCEGRLISGTGFLVSTLDGSGNQSIVWSQNPTLSLESYQATTNNPFGNIVIVGANGKMYQMDGPATASLFLQTNAVGQVYFGTLPATTVPDPLNITDLSVSNEATINTLTLNGQMTAPNITAGTIEDYLGLDSTNNVVQQPIADIQSQVQVFFESPTATSTLRPNDNQNANAYLTIGNTLFTSNSSLFTVVDSQTIKCLVAGTYVITWSALVKYTAGGAWNAGAFLTVNGINVSNGGFDPNSDIGLNQNSIQIAFQYAYRFAVNDVVKLQVPSTVAANTDYRQVGITFVRTGA